MFGTARKWVHACVSSNQGETDHKYINNVATTICPFSALYLHIYLRKCKCVSMCTLYETRGRKVISELMRLSSVHGIS